MLQTVTTPIKNFLSCAKTSLSSFLSSHSDNSVCMSINCLEMLPRRTSLNCQDTSSCMMINCPPRCAAQSCIQSHDRPCDCPTVRTDSTTNCASLQNLCPDLDPLSSMDSLQTHDSLVTPESPHLPSLAESLEEGPTEDVEVTQVRTNDTQVQTNDSLAYDSLVTALSRLSLKPNPDPLSDLHHDSTSPPP